MQSIVDVLRSHAGTHPDRSLYSFHNLKGDTVESVTYRQFDRSTNYLASRFAGIPGLEPGRPVLLAFGPRLAMITSFFACVKMGAIPVPVPPISAASGHAGLERLGKVAADSGAQAILYDGRQHKALLDILASRRRESEAPGITTAAELNWIDPATISGQLDEFMATPSDTLFLQYTSGSTSAPRGAVVSHANVIANCPAPQDVPRVTLSWLPHFHDMGLIGYHLFPLLCGDTAHLFSPADFLRRPALWLELITRLKATHTSAPNFAFDYCARQDKMSDAVLARLDLSSLQDIMNASEPVRCDTLTAFRQRFAACGLKELGADGRLWPGGEHAEGHGRRPGAARRQQGEAGERPCGDGARQERSRQCRQVCQLRAAGSASRSPHRRSRDGRGNAGEHPR